MHSYMNILCSICCAHVQKQSKNKSLLREGIKINLSCIGYSLCILCKFEETKSKITFSFTKQGGNIAKQRSLMKQL